MRDKFRVLQGSVTERLALWTLNPAIAVQIRARPWTMIDIALSSQNLFYFSSHLASQQPCTMSSATENQTGLSRGGLEKLNQPTRHHPYRSNVNGLLNVHVRFAYRDIRRIRFAFRDTTFAEPG